MNQHRPPQPQQRDPQQHQPQPRRSHRVDSTDPHGTWRPQTGPAPGGTWPPPAPATVLPRNGLGIASLVLGVFALFTAFIPLLWLPALGMAVSALALGLAARARLQRRHADNRRTTWAGIAVSAGATALAIAGMVIFFNATSQFVDDLDALSSELGTGTAPVEAPPGAVPEPPVLGADAEPATAPAADGFGSGTYLVGDEIEPGTYRSAGPTSSAMPYCYWARLSALDGEFDSLIANDGGDGPSLVTIAASDRAFETSGCQAWERVE